MKMESLDYFNKQCYTQQANSILCLFNFLLGFMARQDYFTHFEPSQSIGGAKTGDHRKNKTNTWPPQAEHGLSYMWPELGVRWRVI